MSQQLNKQALFQAYQSGIEELDAKRISRNTQQIRGWGYNFNLMLVLMQDTLIDAAYNSIFAIGVGLIGAILTAPVGAGLIVFAILFKFFYLLLVFLCQLTFFQSHGVRLGSKIIVMVLLMIAEQLPFFSILPLSTLGFVARVFIENKARKHKSVELLLDVAEITEKFKKLGRSAR